MEAHFLPVDHVIVSGELDQRIHTLLYERERWLVATVRICGCGKAQIGAQVIENSVRLEDQRTRRRMPGENLLHDRAKFIVTRSHKQGALRSGSEITSRVGSLAGNGLFPDRRCLVVRVARDLDRCPFELWQRVNQAAD